MGEGEDSAPAPAGPKGVDAFFSKMSGQVSEKVSAFVAFLFLMLAFGILIGYFVMLRAPEFIHQTILAPVLLGLIAYYNRTIAMFLFVIALAFIVLVA